MENLAVEISVARRDFTLRTDLVVAPGETLALVGPSGAGKTTVLRAIAGLVRPENGRIIAGGRVWFDAARGLDVPAEERSVGLVFQHYALFPHLSVRDNVAFGARGDVDALLARFALQRLAGARPRELSGGEQQRVAIARALARRPAVLLLDEPMASLDPETRSHVRAELAALLGELDTPSLVVTHDYLDAATLAGRVGVLRDGTVLQIASPAALLAQPNDAFVAAFTGANVLRGTARAGGGGLTEVILDGGYRVVSAETARGPVAVVVQPWDVTVAHAAPDESSSMNVLSGEVTTVAHLGSRVRVGVGPVIAEITSASAERLGLGPGARAVAVFKATTTRLLAL